MEARANPTSPSPATVRTRREVEAAHAREAREQRRRGLLTGACFVLAVLGLVASGVGLPRPLVLALYVAACAAGAVVPAVRAVRELAEGMISVDVLMLLAAAGAAALGQWPEAALLLFLFSLSGTLEGYVLGRTRRAIESLLQLAPEQARVRRDGVEQDVPVDELRPGDVMLVRPGDRLAADGVVIAGTTAVNQSILTGESMPVDKGPGDPVFAATLNATGAVEVRVLRPPSASTLGRIVALVEEAQDEKARSASFTEWFGQRYTLAVLAVALVTLIVPLALGHAFGPSFYRAMTVLVVASPCAVVMAIPATILAAITAAARAGVLFKGGVHLERSAAVRAVAFDKTGTLTLGRPRLVGVQPAADDSADSLLSLAAAAEGRSEHPVAAAILDAARERGLACEPAADMQALPGRGLTARVGEHRVLVGSARLLGEQGVPIPDDLTRREQEWAADGWTCLFVAADGRARGVLAVADTLRPGAQEAVAHLRELGVVHQELLTGDHRLAAAAIARELGIDCKAELLPEDKLRRLHELRDRYGTVAMVGDGINDAPALAAADLGIALGGAGTDVALETADMVLMADDLRHLPYAVRLARQANRIVRQNLVFAFAVMAALLLVTYLGRLWLPLAVFGHEGSTVLVILNALRLLAFPPPAAQKSSSTAPS